MTSKEGGIDCYAVALQETPEPVRIKI
jgi:hypothetical protein